MPLLCAPPCPVTRVPSTPNFCAPFLHPTSFIHFARQQRLALLHVHFGLHFCDPFHALLVSSPFSCFFHLFRLRLFFHTIFSYIKSLQIAFLHTSSLFLFIRALPDDPLIAPSAHPFFTPLPCYLPCILSMHIFPVLLTSIALSCFLSRLIFLPHFHASFRGYLFLATSTHLFSLPVRTLFLCFSSTLPFGRVFSCNFTTFPIQKPL